MGIRKRALVLSGLAFSALLIAGKLLYDNRPRARVPSQEGLEDPLFTRGYLWVSRLPQMRLLRWVVARRVVQAAPHGQAVDLGCGPGQLSLGLAGLAPGLHVTGVDLSEEMIALARENALRARLQHRVSFKQGDGAGLPFPDGSQDLVVSTLSLHHWRNPVQVLDEIARVLRPGGQFLIFDLRRDLGLLPWLLLWFVTRVVVPPALRNANEPLASRDAAYTPGEVKALAAGSRLSEWQVVQGPLWIFLESAPAPRS
jgi:SAM-dependent methyltransferase